LVFDWCNFWLYPPQSNSIFDEDDSPKNQKTLVESIDSSQKEGKEMKVEIVATNEIRVLAENPADIAFLEFFLTKKPRAFMPAGNKEYLRLVMGNTDITPALLNEVKEQRKIGTENLSKAAEAELPDPPRLDAVDMDTPIDLRPSEIEDIPEIESVDDLDFGGEIPELEGVDEEELEEEED
jgi:hypothetical protein